MARRPRMSAKRPFSALIANLGPLLYTTLESFGNLPRFPVFLPCHPSLDHALNCAICQETPPDRKSSLEKGGVLHRASRDAREVDGNIPIANPPLSALITILTTLCQLSRNSFGIVVFFPLSSQPELCPESPVSPIITAKQEMVSRK